MFAQLGGAISSLFGGKKTQRKNSKSSKSTKRQQRQRGGGVGIGTNGVEKKHLMGGSRSSKSKSKSSSQRRHGGAVRSGSPFKY